MLSSNCCTIFLCADENKANDQTINIFPASETEFTISYKEPGCLVKRWTCDVRALHQYIHTLFASLLADNSNDQTAKIQISTPLFPSFLMKTFCQPKNIETIRDLLLRQLGMFVRNEADGRVVISWPYSTNAGMTSF